MKTVKNTKLEQREAHQVQPMVKESKMVVEQVINRTDDCQQSLRE